MLTAVWLCFMLYFFRDPERRAPEGDELLLAGADGTIRSVSVMDEPTYLCTETVRVSIFLSPFDVHVNRTPIAGRVKHLAYHPGRHFLTIQDKASVYNQHSSIYIEGTSTRCLVKQIVGPLVRRVVYWLECEQQLARGERIGMMKFGSRLDMYFPKDEVEILVEKGDKVVAAESGIGRVKRKA